MSKPKKVIVRPSPEATGEWHLRMERAFEISTLKGTRIEQGQVVVEACLNDTLAARIHAMICRENAK